MSPKKPPKYDYYNPSTWIVQEEEAQAAASAGERASEVAEAAKTNDAFSRFAKNIAAADERYAGAQVQVSEDPRHMDKCVDEGWEGGGDYDATPCTPLCAKPDSGANAEAGGARNPTPPTVIMRALPHRVGGMKIFADEEYSDSDDSNYSGGDQEEQRQWAVTRGFPGVATPPRPQHMRRPRRDKQAAQGLSVLEQRQKMLARRAKQDAAKYRAKLLSIDTGELGELDHEAIVERMMNVAAIPPPAPVCGVAALGKDGCAAVWWDYDRSAIGMEAWVSTWEIKRYRLDKDREWRYKGTTVLNEHHLVHQNRATIKELENDAQYRFSVVGVNVRGQGFNSAQSAPVMVEAVLPPGWFRFWDERVERFFYSNIKTQQSSWQRPELDRWYLDESVVLVFDKEEIEHLKELYVLSLIVPRCTRQPSSSVTSIYLRIPLCQYLRAYLDVPRSNPHLLLFASLCGIYSLSIVSSLSLWCVCEGSWRKQSTSCA